MEALENVKVGDKLIMRNRWHTSIITVEKVQKKFVIANGYKFRKSGSLVTSDSWSFADARPATDADIAKIERARRRSGMIEKCHNIQFENLTDIQLEYILKIANIQ